MVVEMGNGVSLDYHDFYEPTGEILHQHDTFLVTEDDFDQILGRFQAGSQEYWADPGLAERARSTKMTAAAGCTSRIPTGFSWKSSPGPTAPYLREQTSPALTTTPGSRRQLVSCYPRHDHGIVLIRLQ
jgi:hypothetical protein